MHFNKAVPTRQATRAIQTMAFTQCHTLVSTCPLSINHSVQALARATDQPTRAGHEDLKIKYALFVFRHIRRMTGQDVGNDVRHSIYEKIQDFAHDLTHPHFPHRDVLEDRASPSSIDDLPVPAMRWYVDVVVGKFMHKCIGNLSGFIFLLDVVVSPTF